MSSNVYGLSPHYLRVDIINTRTTRTDEGDSCRRREAVFKAFNFDKVLNSKIEEDSEVSTLLRSDRGRERRKNGIPKGMLPVQTY
jgi:flagellar basal body rod protein FlgC